MRLELSRRTQADLDDIRDYSVGRFGPRRTIDYLDAIEQTFRRMLDHPQIGVVHEALRGVRSLPTGEHRVYYSVAADTITIVRIKDGRYRTDGALGASTGGRSAIRASPYDHPTPQL